MTRVMVALAGVGLVVGLAFALGHEGRLRAATNGVTNGAFVRVLQPGHTFCQPGGTVPADAGALRMRIGTYGLPGPPLTVRFLDGKRPITGGALKLGWPQGDIDIPIRPIDKTIYAERLCVHNAGPGRLAFAGELETVRTELFHTDRGSWFSHFGALRERFGEGKSTWYGDGSLIVALLVVLAGAGLTVFTAVRWIR